MLWGHFSKGHNNLILKTLRMGLKLPAQLLGYR